MTKNKKYLLLSLSTLVLLSATSCSSGGASAESGEAVQDSARTVELAVVQVQPLRLMQEFTAQLEAKVTNNITAQSGGRLKQLLVKVGDRVGQGQVIARMEATQASQAQIQLTDAKTNFDRMDELYKVGGVSKAQWDNAKSALEQARLAYNNVAENTTLRSPISGVVTAKNYDNGDMTSPQLPVVVIQQIAPVKAMVNVSEKYYSLLKERIPVTLRVDALEGKEFSGTISNVYPTLDPTTHTIATEIEVPNRDASLRPGMYARVHIDFGSRDVLSVPDKAVVRQVGSGARYVYLYRDGKAVYQVVELGDQQGDYYEVLKGLQAGDQVIISAPSTLKNGQAVQPQQKTK